MTKIEVKDANEAVENSEAQVESMIENELDKMGAGEIPEDVKQEETKEEDK